MDDREKRKAAKEYLMQLRYMSERIDELEADISEQQERLILPARPLQERVSGSRQPDTLERKLTAVLDKQLKHDELVFKYLLKRDTIVMQVLELAEPLYAEVLCQVFLKFQKMADAAKALNISSQYLFHIMPSALISFYDLWLAHRAQEKKSTQLKA